MKTPSALLLSVLLVACGGGGGGGTPSTPSYPPAGTILSTTCDGYTLVEKVADGAGGSREQVTTRSPDCGWNPEPYGKLSETSCEEPYTLVSVFHDGEYGFYEEREYDVPECGFIASTLDVEIDNTYGDRFKPVVVTVAYTVQGEPSQWTYEVETGRAVKVDDNTLHIYGDGAGTSVDFNLYINEERFSYQLKREPRCAVGGSSGSIGTDCLGYQQRASGDGAGLIYYGDDDTTMVNVEIAITWYDSSALEPLELTSGSRFEKSERLVAQYNEWLARDDIYVTFVLHSVWAWGNAGLRRGENLMRSLPVDIGLGKGTTYPNTCGVAYPNWKYDRAGFGFSNCRVGTDLHELGHVIGLAHGPNNFVNPAEGYLFPEFGHGDYDQCRGGNTDDIMSYGNKEHFYNSRQDCADRFGDESDRGLPAGDRFRADSAYHWNRVRFDLSLIHNEHAKESPAKARRLFETDDDRPLIVD